MDTTVEDVSLDDFLFDRLADKERFDLRCPDCDEGTLRLRRSNFATSGFYYACNQYGCRGNHSARSDGSPKGVPADAETRRWRRLAHQTFERLWSGEQPFMDKQKAYEWMWWKLRLPGTPGIGHLSRVECESLLTHVKEAFPALKTAWDRLDSESF